MLPVTGEGVPLCFLPEFADEPHAYIHLWKHHAAQPQADRMTEKAVERNEKWLPAYGGKVSCESALPKLWQLLEESPRVCAAMAYWIEAVDWLVWQLCGNAVISSCCAGYKHLYCAPDGYPSEDYLSSLDPRLARVFRDKCSLPVAPVFSKAGTLTEEMARRLGLAPGTTVAVGMIDAHACAPAAGITGPGEMVMILGTSACMMTCGEDYRSIPGCYAVKDGILPGLWGFEGGQNSVGDLFSWMLRECVPEHTLREARDRQLSIHEYLTELASRRKPGESGLLALDWFNGNRSVLMDILQEENSLQHIAKLVGPDALPDSQRLTLMVAEYIKNAFLQQNSFDKVDMFCSPEKQSWMMKLLVNFTKRARTIIKKGATLADISTMRCLPRILRMKSEIENGDLKAMAAMEQTVNSELDSLERRFGR